MERTKEEEEKIDMLLERIYQLWKEGRLWESHDELRQLGELGVIVDTDCGFVTNRLTVRGV